MINTSYTLILNIGNMMKKWILSILGLCCVCTVSRADVLWIGALSRGDGKSFFNSNNWDSDGDLSAPYLHPKWTNITGEPIAADHYTLKRVKLQKVREIVMAGNETQINLSEVTFLMRERRGIRGEGSVVLKDGSHMEADYINGPRLSIDGTSSLVIRGGSDSLDESTISLKPGGKIFFQKGSSILGECLKSLHTAEQSLETLKEGEHYLIFEHDYYGTGLLVLDPREASMPINGVNQGSVKDYTAVFSVGGVSLHIQDNTPEQ